MDVVFDAYWWERGPESNRQVMRSLVRAWIADHPQDRVIMAVRAADAPAVRAQVPASVELLPLRARIHGAAVALELPLRARRRGFRGVVVAHNFTPVTGPAVTFVHDVLFQERPEWFTRVERAYFWSMPRLARRARTVFTSSSTEADRIRRINPRLRRVVPIGLGVPDDLVTATPERPPLPAGLELDAGFFLTVSRLNVRKNLDVLLRAVDDEAVRRTGLPTLVVGENSGRAVQLAPGVAELERQGRLHFTGFVSTPQLRWLYEHATAFVFPSLDEGFGLPPVEAASMGCPVLVSERLVFRETVGEVAAFFDPEDARQLAGLMAAAAAGGRTGRSYTASTWQDCARLLRAGVTAVVSADATTRR